MELRDFVKSTLLAIVDGVKEAQNGEAKKHINPEPTHRSEKFASDYVTTEGLRACPVKFDVAVTVSAETTKEGGGKISVLSFGGLDGKLTGKEGESSVTRIQFQVPVAFAYGDRSE
ncbi:MAG: hypothetical protein CR217_16515 [Beijerinckiaceae bacterium]|nr:MAG: hypothetical protein CR217_16515 [Beijerinckiaceae bacterium]